MKLNFEMQKIKFSVSPEHRNKMLWEGVITNVGVPSTGAPGGSDGRRVVFTQEGVIKNYQTFIGMPLNCTFPDGWFADGSDVFTGHGTLIIGFIEKSWISGEDLMASGVIWKDNFPDVAFMTVNGEQSLGFSIEAYCTESHTNEEDGFLYIDDFTGVGCAMLWQNTAAFGNTKITQLVAKKEDDSMDENKFKELLASTVAEFGKTIGEQVEKVNASLEQLAVGIAETKEVLNASKVDEENQELETMKASKEEADTKITELTAEIETLKASIEETKEPNRTTGQFDFMTKFSTDDPKPGASPASNISEFLNKKFSK